MKPIFHLHSGHSAAFFFLFSHSVTDRFCVHGQIAPRRQTVIARLLQSTGFAQRGGHCDGGRHGTGALNVGLRRLESVAGRSQTG